MELLQKRQQIKAQRHVAGADMHLPQLQVQHLPHLLHAPLYLLIALLHMGVQKLPFPGKSDALGSALEQGHAKAPFQLLQGLAYGRLGNGEFIGSPGNAPQLRGIVKYLEIFQVPHHGFPCTSSPVAYTHPPRRISPYRASGDSL